MQMSEDRDRITEEAAVWFVDNRAGTPLDDGRRIGFNRWLESSPRHAEEYLEIAQLARDLSGVAAHADVDVEALVQRALAEEDPGKVVTIPARPKHLWLPAALAAAVSVVALGVLWWDSSRTGSIQTPSLRLTSGHGELLTHTLEDGSVLQLNTDTSVIVRYAARERRIEIERGQAAFSVAHDAARPFRVSAGTTEILDIGTKFDVYLRPEATLVTVMEGRVEVSSRRTPGRLQLVAGQQVRVAPGASPETALQVDAERETAYLRRQIVFERKSLAAVADEFNRYVAVPIEIATPQLRQMRITGSFSIDDVESFLAYLRMQEGIRVEITPTRILVSKT